MSVFAQDAAAGDAQSATTDATFFLGDVKTELAWLAAHPPAACYSGVYDQWRAVVSQTKTALTAFAAGSYTKADAEMTALDKRVSAFASNGINTSC